MGSWCVGEGRAGRRGLLVVLLLVALVWMLVKGGVMVGMEPEAKAAAAKGSADVAAFVGAAGLSPALAAKESVWVDARAPVVSRAVKRTSVPAPARRMGNRPSSSGLQASLLDSLMSKMGKPYGPPVVMGGEEIMQKKAHGSCEKAPMQNLRFGVDYKVTDQICCFNRHFAEYSGYFLSTDWQKEVQGKQGVEYYDPVSGRLLFTAPVDRSYEDFLAESKKHGWPSFRDNEVNWETVRVLPGGETVSVDGTHLGHNLPDSKGNRYCINLVSVAGNKL
ncbi:hypothetical protein FVE85_8080 [Porphyridium purpureum]|uniref:Uncharacterized protein n=1 Tax=Porphyridium purpureum TaxID=35688 RepID=A0A5J4YPD7_PORPP|nr:hypothetical protein FVE85_8080 [Porphyridium purpureum]|eukprot:POR5610..scf295_9